MEGFEQLADGPAVMDALASHRHSPDVPWTDLSPHVIERGLVKVFPLARVIGQDPAAREHFERACTDLEMHGIHYFGGDGFHNETWISLDEGYGERLAEAGIRPEQRCFAWRVHDYAVVNVRESAGDVSTLSLHVVPAEWIWPRLGEAKRDQSRRRTMAKQLAAADPRWEWPRQ